MPVPSCEHVTLKSSSETNYTDNFAQNWSNRLSFMKLDPLSLNLAACNPYNRERYIPVILKVEYTFFFNNRPIKKQPGMVGPRLQLVKELPASFVNVICTPATSLRLLSFVAPQIKTCSKTVELLY